MPGILLSNQPGYTKRIVAGADWTTANAKEFKTTRAKLKSDGFEVVSLTSSNSQTKDLINYGLIGIKELSSQGHSVALGAWLANTFRSGTVLALEKVEVEGEEDVYYWLCIVNDGQVVTGTDALIEDWESAAETAESTIEALGIDDVGFVGTDATQLSFNHQEDESPALAEVLSKAAAQKSRLKAPGSDKSLILLTLGVIVICSLGGLAYYYLNQGESDAEAALKAEQRREAQRQQAEQEYQNILNEVGGMSSAGSTVRSLWGNPIKPTSTKIEGWLLESIVCESGSCAFNYTNTDLTLPETLKRAIAGRCSVLQVSADGTKAQCNVKTSGVPLLPTSNDSGQIAEEQLKRIFLSQADINLLQGSFMTVATLGEGTSYAINEAIEYPFQGSRHLPFIQMWDQGEWGLSFPIEYIEAVSRMLGKHRSVALKSLKINWASRVVELKGLYFSQQEGAE